jgi:hypothetical protein
MKKPEQPLRFFYRVLVVTVSVFELWYVVGSHGLLWLASALAERMARRAATASASKRRFMLTFLL